MALLSLIAFISLSQRLDEPVPQAVHDRFIEVAQKIEDGLGKKRSCYTRSMTKAEAWTASYTLLKWTVENKEVPHLLTKQDFQFLLDQFENKAWVAPLVGYGRNLNLVKKAKEAYNGLESAQKSEFLTVDLLYKQGIFQGDKDPK